MNNSINRQQYSPNFGMALVITKKAEPFVESLPKKERQYLRELGKRIKGSRNDINIEENGAVSLTYKPKASEIRLVSDENREAVKAADKAKEKRFKNEMTFGEKVDMTIDDIKTLAKVAKIKLSLGKSKFMKRLQINEALQAQWDRADAMEERITARIAQKDAAAKKDAESLMAEFGEK
ncbi:MAG: hypothetical protein K6E29_06810 [Cyanobacteria bacterium RUI128]|nr:hypothetical protein [Cyanobacteria bacterium RUI128]